MTNLSDVFTVEYGHSLALNRLSRASAERGVPFVSRKMVDNGIAAYVAKLESVEPNPAGDLTCALSGSGVLATFIQDRPYYTAYHVACLRPKVELTLPQKMYYCMCIRANRYRYGWGRQANRSVRSIHIPSPEEIPAWLDAPTMQLGRIAQGVARECERLELPTSGSETGDGGTVSDLFEVEYGHSYELCNLVQDAEGINYVSRRAGNNGVSARVKRTEDDPSPAGSLSVALGGTVLETYVQPEPFYSGRDIAVLSARQPLSLAAKLFYALAIKSNRFRYNYGRQANRTLGDLRLPRPPAWVAQTDLASWQSDIAAKAAQAFE